MGAPSFPFFFRTLSKPWHISRSAPIAPRQCRELKNRQWALHTWLHIAGDFLQTLSRSPQWCSSTPLHADWPGLFSSERGNCNYTCLVSKLLPDKKAILLSVWVGKGGWLRSGSLQAPYVFLLQDYITKWQNASSSQKLNVHRTHQFPMCLDLLGFVSFWWFRCL